MAIFAPALSVPDSFCDVSIREAMRGAGAWLEAASGVVTPWCAPAVTLLRLCLAFVEFHPCSSVSSLSVLQLSMVAGWTIYSTVSRSMNDEGHLPRPMRSSISPLDDERS